MGVVILIAFLWLLSELIFKGIVRKYSFVSVKILRRLFWYHLLFAGVYYLYAINNPSDSIAYYQVLGILEGSWLDTMQMRNWGVFFVAYPFKTYFDFSYEMCMIVFSWFGFIGFVFAYLFFAENIKEKVIVFKRYDLLTLLLFLPNMHFWSASLGKGSVIFMGIMMFIYAIKFPRKRMVFLLLGCFFIYCIRPHVMFFMIVGVIFGTFFGTDRKLSVGYKFLIIVSGLIFIYLASSSILAVANLEQSDNLVDDFTQFASERSEGLSEKAGSGVAISSYPLPLKFFTFWFRPLFIDVPNFLGIFSSMENLLYLLLFLKICNRSFIQFIKKAPAVVKTSAMIFLLTSFAMTFVMSNLGIIMRQKSMVMYFLFFVVYYYLAEEKIKRRLYWERYDANSNEKILEESRELIR